MRRLQIYIAVCALTVAAIPSVSFSAGPDGSGCIVPVFGTDKSAVIRACTALLDQVNIGNEERARLLKIRGRTFHMSDKIGAAIQDFDDAIRFAPNDAELRVRRGKAALNRREFDVSTLDKRTFETAVDYAKQALAIDRNHAGAYDLLGLAGIMSGDLGMAKAAYDKALALEPNNVVVRFHRVYLYKRAYAHKAVIEELDALLRLPGNELDTNFTSIRNKEVSYRTMMRLERAAMLVTMGRLEDAEKAHADWIKIEPGAVSYGWRALMRLQRSQFDLAQADLDKALSFDGSFWFLHNLQGNLYLYTDQYDRAVASYTRAITEIPQSGLNYWGRALAFRALKRTDEATRDAMKAIEVDPDFPGRIVARVTKAGYLKPSSSETDMMPALRDAVHACMVDERC